MLNKKALLATTSGRGMYLTLNLKNGSDPAWGIIGTASNLEIDFEGATIKSIECFAVGDDPGWGCRILFSEPKTKDELSKLFPQGVRMKCLTTDKQADLTTAYQYYATSGLLGDDQLVDASYKDGEYKFLLTKLVGWGGGNLRIYKETCANHPRFFERSAA